MAGLESPVWNSFFIILCLQQQQNPWWPAFFFSPPPFNFWLDAETAVPAVSAACTMCTKPTPACQIPVCAETDDHHSIDRTPPIPVPFGSWKWFHLFKLAVQKTLSPCPPTCDSALVRPLLRTIFKNPPIPSIPVWPESYHNVRPHVSTASLADLFAKNVIQVCWVSSVDLFMSFF